MGALSDYGLVALSETYTLSRQELMLLRGLGGKVFETIGSSFPRLGVSVGIKLPSLKIATLGEVLAALPSGIVLTVRFGERAGGILAMSASLKAATMQMVFAGNRQSNGSEGLTDLELAAVGKMLGKAIADGFSAGFAKLFGVEASSTGAFSMETMAGEALLAEDKVISFSSSVDGSGSAMMTAIELSAVMALRGRLKEATKLGPLEPENSVVTAKRVGDVRVELSAVLGSFVTNFASLRGVKPGCYIPLGKLRGSAATVDIYAGGRCLGAAVVVEDRGWRRIFIQHQTEG